MVTALDVVYAIETADFFGGVYDHTAHRHPFGGLDGCGCPPELVDAWLLHCSGNRFHYPDGVHVARSWVNVEVTSGRPARRSAGFWISALALAGGTWLVLGASMAAVVAVVAAAVDLGGRWVRSRRRNRVRRVAPGVVVRSGQLPGRFEMQVTMAAMSLVLDQRVSTIRHLLGVDAATEVDREGTAALYQAAVTASKVRELAMEMKTSGRYRPLPHHTLWVRTGGRDRLNQRVVRTADGAYFSSELTRLANRYRDWVTQMEQVSALIGWDVRSGQLAPGESANQRGGP